MEIKKEIVTGDPNGPSLPILVIGALKNGFFGCLEKEVNGKLYVVKPVLLMGIFEWLINVERSGRVYTLMDLTLNGFEYSIF